MKSDLEKLYSHIADIEVAMMTTRRADGHLPDWKAWFPKEDDDRHGTKDDPRMVLIGVDVHIAVFLEVNKPQPVVLFEVLKGMITGSTPELGETHVIKK